MRARRILDKKYNSQIGRVRPLSYDNSQAGTSTGTYGTGPTKFASMHVFARYLAALHVFRLILSIGANQFYFLQ